MIYFDNAATTFPKPNSVINAVNYSLKHYCANPGRGGYKTARETAELVYNTREKTGIFFGVSKPENVVFTNNCTCAINFVIKGLAHKGAHFIISSLEHNAVLRPLESLKKQGVCSFSIANVEKTDEDTVENFKRLIKAETVAVICTGASNVFGKILPVQKLAKLAHKNNLLFVVDAAQTAGVVNIDCEKDEIDYLCVAAHKGLFAPMSLGILLSNCDKKLNTVIQGGTGSDSFNAEQPEYLPERFESGTLSVPLIAGLSAGIDFINKNKMYNIYNHEKRLMNYFYSQMKNIDDVILYTDWYSNTEKFVPIISFNVKDLTSEDVAEKLNLCSIAVRAGYHCAPLAHISYKTTTVGTVRVAPSIFTEKKDVNLLLNSIIKIAKFK